jgi:hypothetical protein
MKFMWLLRRDKENVACCYLHVACSAGKSGATGDYEVDLLLAVRLLTIRSAGGEPVYSCTQIRGPKELDIGLAFLSKGRQVVDFHVGL